MRPGRGWSFLVPVIKYHTFHDPPLVARRPQKPCLNLPHACFQITCRGQPLLHSMPKCSQLAQDKAPIPYEPHKPTDPCTLLQVLHQEWAATCKATGRMRKLCSEGLPFNPSSESFSRCQHATLANWTLKYLPHGFAGACFGKELFPFTTATATVQTGGNFRFARLKTCQRANVCSLAFPRHRYVLRCCTRWK